MFIGFSPVGREITRRAVRKVASADLSQSGVRPVLEMLNVTASAGSKRHVCIA
jgi:hypothetical protein